MTTSPSDTDAAPLEETVEDAASQDESPQEKAHPLAGYADRVAELVGGEGEINFDTIKVRVPTVRWVEVLTTARDELGLVFFSWLSAIDWAKDVQVGDPLSEEVQERFELLCTVADLTEGRRVTFSTDLPKEAARVASLVGVFAGADWHERECHEMFGVAFDGHPNLRKLYLPDGFEGHPLRKSFPLLTREVKPWPGKVDVEGMPSEEGSVEGEGDEPSEENPEA
ncbi:MAG: NADH-quinone oxidoreductase subunit C [Acidimicrobiia bacterium]